MDHVQKRTARMVITWCHVSACSDSLSQAEPSSSVGSSGFWGWGVNSPAPSAQALPPGDLASSSTDLLNILSFYKGIFTLKIEQEQIKKRFPKEHRGVCSPASLDSF